MSLPAAFFHVHFGFSWLGLLTVALPLLPNIAWALTPSHHREGPVVYCGRFWELAETVTRLLFILGFIWLANRHFTQFLLPAAAGIFLTFYYFRWILYFTKKCNPRVLEKKFAGIPVPMAVFPVVYFLIMAVWFQNLPLILIVAAFGVFHIRNTLLVTRRPDEAAAAGVH
ncbi:MAG: hypothetical protein DBX52_03245 [Clostridiales bacterium]|nr:MAG: hypothetical protein DBX52_03245 [Clostridiales bacterium]